MLGVLGLYFVACAIYFVALRSAIRLPCNRSVALWVVGTSIAFRALLLPTPPYQEIDIYRYLWDGAVVASGGDPYEHPPADILAGMDATNAAERNPSLARLVKLTAEQPELDEIVRTIHYTELPTPYPPVSQAVFAAAAVTASEDWSAFGRLVWLKLWLTAFDVATLLLVLDLLRTTGLPVGWALAYGWAPLVLKEIAGSGHLDVIATFLAVASLAVAARGFSGQSRIDVRGAVVASALLGLGVGAKLFPVLLAPLLAAGLVQRAGWRTAAYGAIAFLATSALTLAPMLAPLPASTPVIAQAEPLDISPVESLPLPPGVSKSDAIDGKTAGLAAFLQQWEMNDLLFMILYENTRSQSGVPPEQTPWFDVTPEAWNAPLVGRDPLAFKATRAVTLALSGVIAVWLAVAAARRLDGTPASLSGWLRAAFLTLAWFWLLAPTQNPWYWCWVLPLVPWSGGRAWLAMSVAAFGYYLRFWLETHSPESGFIGTPYDGEFFFYLVVPWLEFGPILVWLAAEACLVRWRPARDGAPAHQTGTAS